MKNAELLQFQKPGRYIGEEWNLNFKRPTSKDLRICLAFPEKYEVGMSNLGFRIIYDLFNAHSKVVCERCFMPGKDLEEYLLARGKPLFSLETKTALKDFDIVAFSLNYELNLVNFLKMLALSGIPLESQGRERPLILVGGLHNPEPIAKFIDLAFLGEFEESSFMFIEQLKKARNLCKEERLAALRTIPGTYIPSLYYQEAGGIRPKSDEAPFPLRRAYVKDLNRQFYPSQWLVPYIAPVFDRVQIELQRGCPHQCKFCQAHCTYYPYRERDTKLVIEKIKAFYGSTGYEVISLLGLSVIDYSGLYQLLAEIIPYLKERRVSLSIPSLRPTGKASKIIEMLTYAKKPGITVALEAGNDALRRSIGKDIDIQDCLELIRAASHLGYKHFKFYFMIGLPGETDDDVISIADVLEHIADIYKREKGTIPQINASISYFVPKPFSIFEELPMQGYAELKAKETLLKKRAARSRFIKLTFPDLEKALLEHLLARADRRITPILEGVFSKELRVPGSFFDLRDWRDKAESLGLDLALFLQSTATLPRHIQTQRPHVYAKS